MKKTIILFGIILMGIINLQAQCYTVRSVENKTPQESLSSKKYTFGIKQLTEEIMSTKWHLCENGDSVNVKILSIEAPTTGISIGPFMFKKKVTIVNVSVSFGGNTYVGVGESNLSVSATFLELRDENLPFEKSVFSSAVKKALQDAIAKS